MQRSLFSAVRALPALVVACLATFASGCDDYSMATVQGETSPAYTLLPREGGPGGPMVVAGNGWTLYVFDADTPNVSVCADRCAEMWPPLTITGATPSAHPDLKGVVGTLVRPDGRTQVSYNGRPLYYFAGDREMSDTLGDGIDGRWHVARPSLTDEFQAARSAATAVIRADEQRAWQPVSVSIAPGGTVRWQNVDQTSAHGVACIDTESTSPCPWPDAMALPPATRSPSGELVPSEAEAAFPRPGVFAFRCTVFPEMTGTVVVGAPATPAGR